ncbi:NfeD family protein [Halopseudomonas salegens]|uniref:NfeD-like C-terminal domain-containing protein n=1 Tax=Halopseudomonas salegens TaxID=1434072 RepID=A0A1H2HI09_9GAMM|nr:NfeD family protein [Halopseudomonas salegens]SDU31188.1 hypothetical protein SAMN05216210_3040 [Halopseudomonas salegens]
MLASLITGYPFWLLLGLLLLISEFFVPGLIAAFFAIGALIVGLLTLFGVIESLPIQLTLFALISLAALFGLRKHFKRWLTGATSDRSLQDQDDSGLIGTRVKVLTDFTQGIGHVSHNGAKWDAESSDPLKAGDAAWIISHRGIVLTVSSTLPANLS